LIQQQNAYAQRVFDKVNFQEVSESSVQEFDLYRFLTRNSKESTDSFCLIATKEIQKQSIMSILVRKTLDAIRKLKQCDLPEETMLFMPIFFDLLDLDSGLYQSLFVTVIEICCD